MHEFEFPFVWFVFFAVSTACTTSGLAAVYIEKVFKTGEASLWVQNMHLSSWSILAVGGPCFSDSKRLQQNVFFGSGMSSYSWWCCCRLLGECQSPLCPSRRQYIKRFFFCTCDHFDVFRVALHFVMGIGIACILISIQAQTREGGYREVPTVPIDVELSHVSVIRRADASPETAKTVPAA